MFHTRVCTHHLTAELTLFSFFLIYLPKKGNQKVNSIIVTEVTVRNPFITYSSQNPWNFLDREVIMIKVIMMTSVDVLTINRYELHFFKKNTQLDTRKYNI